MIQIVLYSPPPVHGPVGESGVTPNGVCDYHSSRAVSRAAHGTFACVYSVPLGLCLITTGGRNVWIFHTSSGVTAFIEFVRLLKFHTSALSFFLRTWGDIIFIHAPVLCSTNMSSIARG